MTHRPEELKAKIARLEEVLKGEPKFQGEFAIVRRAIAKAKRRLKDLEQPKTLAKAMCEAGAIVSMSEARRAIAQKTVLVNDEVVKDVQATVEEEDEVKVGKGSKQRRFKVS